VQVPMDVEAFLPRPTSLPTVGTGYELLLLSNASQAYFLPLSIEIFIRRRSCSASTRRACCFPNASQFSYCMMDLFMNSSVSSSKWGQGEDGTYIRAIKIYSHSPSPLNP